MLYVTGSNPVRPRPPIPRQQERSAGRAENQSDSIGGAGFPTEDPESSHADGEQDEASAIARGPFQSEPQQQAAKALQIIIQI